MRMKIKKVSELTGLSDKTIRFYIDQELIAPSFKENYMGRRSYDFNDDDVELLKNISVLRRFGFTIVEIKLLSLDCANAPRILSTIYERKRYQHDLDVESFNTLECLNNGREYTLSEIAAKLREPSRLLKPAEEKYEIKVKSFASWIVAICFAFAISFIPLFLNLSLVLLMFPLKKYQYIENDTIIPIILCLLGAVVLTAILILLNKKFVSLLFKCIMLLMISCCLIQSSWYFAETDTYFRTNDLDYYLIYPEYIITDMQHEWVVDEIFPLQPFDMDESAKYSCYYDYYPNNRCIDIYLELTLDENELDAEKERVVSYNELHHMFSSPTKYVVYEKNGYVCHVYLFNSKDDYWLYDKESNQYKDVSDKLNIFVADGNQNFGYTGYYDCVMFAYNENTGKVRYSYCEGFEYHPLYELDKAPYYTQVEW